MCTDQSILSLILCYTISVINPHIINKTNMSLMDFFKNLFGGKSEEVEDKPQEAAEGAMPEMGMPAPEMPEEGGMGGGEEEDQSL